MRVVDEAVMGILRDRGLNVHDNYMQVDQTDAEGRAIVTYAMPYLVYSSALGDDDNRRLTGRQQRRSVPFYITYVGLDRNQTKWLGERLREVLQGQRLVVPGHRSWLCNLQESQRIWRDNDATRADGSPLFYGVDIYAVSITLKPATL